MDWLKRFDQGLARGEAALATAWLIAMILAGATQAFFRFCATRLELGFGNEGLEHLGWVDPLLQKGTLWLAFLGASLATREGRHIAVDILPRLAPRKAKLVMRGLVGLATGGVCFVLSMAFWGQVRRIAEEATSFTIYGDSGAIHVCEASAAELAAADVDAPGLFCAARSAFDALGISLQNPQAALQLIVPVMFIVIGVRLVANGIGAFVALGKPEPAPEVASHQGEEG